MSRNKNHDGNSSSRGLSKTAPEGYAGPIKYELNDRAIEFGQVSFFILLAYLLFPGVLQSVIASVSVSTNEIVRYTVVNVSEILNILLFTVLLVVTHELIHYLANQRLGLDPQFGFQFHRSFGVIPEPNPYVVSLGPYINRKQNIIILAAPLVLIDVVALIGLLPGFPSTVEYYARIALLLNTSFAIMDIFNIVRVSSHDAGTLFRNFDIEDNIETYFYPPSELDPDN